MKTSALGRILSATKPELFQYYLETGICDVMSFPDFLTAMKELGTEIITQERSDTGDDHLKAVCPARP